MADTRVAGEGSGGGGSAGSDPTKPPRIQLWPLTQRLLATLLLPVSAAFLLDWALGTAPWLTLITSVFCIPLAGYIVVSATLHDFERVLALVAPEAAEPAADVGAGAAETEAAEPEIAEPETASVDVNAESADTTALSNT